MDKHEIRESCDSGEKDVVHYGSIASGNQVMPRAAERDGVSAELGGVLCFEMEAADEEEDPKEPARERAGGTRHAHRRRPSWRVAML